MTQDSTNSFQFLLNEARNADAGRLAKLLDAYRNYLRLMARLQLNRMLQSRVSPSDLAQESILVAKNAFAGFRGKTEPELLAWLRSVLAQRLIDTNRFHSAKQRDFNLERRMDDSLDHSSRQLQAFFTKEQDSPSRIACRREQEVILANALARLPKDYCDVIVLRHLESKSFAEVADAMQKSVPSVKSIWTRAITRLRSELRAEIE